MSFACGRCDNCEAGRWQECSMPRGTPDPGPLSDPYFCRHGLPAGQGCWQCERARGRAEGYAAGIEEAARVCDGIAHYMAGVCAAAIRALQNRKPSDKD